MENDLRANYVDLSDKSGFKFAADCQICQARYESELVPEKSSLKQNLGHMAGSMTKLLNENINASDINLNARQSRYKEAAEKFDAVFQNEINSFCFKCRRTACPQCWDVEVKLCAECAKEEHSIFIPDPKVRETSSYAQGYLHNTQPGRYLAEGEQNLKTAGSGTPFTSFSTMLSETSNAEPFSSSSLNNSSRSEDHELFQSLSSAEEIDPFQPLPNLDFAKPKESNPFQSHASSFSKPEDEDKDPFQSLPNTGFDRDSFGLQHSGLDSPPPHETYPSPPPANDLTIGNVDAWEPITLPQSSDSSKTVKCPRCYAMNYDFVMRCNQCDLDLLMTCPKCNHLNSIEASKCENCGSALVSYKALPGSPVEPPDTVSKGKEKKQKKEKQTEGKGAPGPGAVGSATAILPPDVAPTKETVPLSTGQKIEQGIERILGLIALILFLVVLGTILIAEFVPGGNDTLKHYLHYDFKAAIDYLIGQSGAILHR